MFCNIFYMFLGAFMGLAFFALDQFDDFRSSVKEMAGGLYLCFRKFNCFIRKVRSNHKLK